MSKTVLFTALFIIIISILLSFLFVSADQIQLKHYTISQDGNEWKIHIHDTLPPEPRDEPGLFAYDTPKAASFRELKYRMLFGVIDKDFLCELQNILWYREMTLPNLTKLSNLQIPKDYTFDLFRWHPTQFSADAYSASKQSSPSSKLSFALYTKEVWSSNYNLHWGFYKNDSIYHIVSQTKIGQHNATETIYFNHYQSGGEHRVVEYTLSAEDKTLHIQERYTDDFKYPNSSYIEPASTDIRIFGEQAGYYFEIRMYDVAKVPSADWFMQFGVKSMSIASQVLSLSMPGILTALCIVPASYVVCLIIRKRKQHEIPHEAKPSP